MKLMWDKLSLQIEFGSAADFFRFYNLLGYVEGRWKPSHEGDVQSLREVANSLLSDIDKQTKGAI